jgi:hypothetical protein
VFDPKYGIPQGSTAHCASADAQLHPHKIEAIVIARNIVASVSPRDVST